MNKHVIIAAVSGVVVGGVIGYFVGRNVTDRIYRDISEDYEADAEALREELHKLRFPDGHIAQSPIIDTLDLKPELQNAGLKPYSKFVLGLDYGNLEVTEFVPAVAEEELTPFEEELRASFVKDEPEEEAEQFERDPDGPYVISVDTFMDDDAFEKLTISYYEDDDTLADDQDRIIPDIEQTIGRKNLDRFGDSDPADKYIVYVRNERKRVDYEVAHEESAYSRVVLGLDEEYLGNRAAKARPLKMRQDD